jgi:hypothetical protein
LEPVLPEEENDNARASEHRETRDDYTKSVMAAKRHA